MGNLNMFAVFLCILITGLNLMILGINLKLYTEILKEKAMRNR